MAWRNWVQTIGRRAGLVVQRWPANRFNAMTDSLALLRRRGYEPSVVIDGGANAGQFAALATGVFPEARLHLIEPQPFCWPALDAFASGHGRATLFKVAVTAPGVRRVGMHGGGEAGSSGAFVVAAGESAATEFEVDSATLDELLGTSVERGHRALLKLDLEGHELPALQGASQLLSKVEVILCEVRFFAINGVDRGSFADIAEYLRPQFALYDVATLSSRPRDLRLRLGDVIFVRRDSPLAMDVAWA